MKFVSLSIYMIKIKARADLQNVLNFNGTGFYRTTVFCYTI